jgi:hypothetical protein
MREIPGCAVLETGMCDEFLIRFGCSFTMPTFNLKKSYIYQLTNSPELLKKDNVRLRETLDFSTVLPLTPDTNDFGVGKSDNNTDTKVLRCRNTFEL